MDARHVPSDTRDRCSVTVIIPARNAGADLKLAVSSALRQTRIPQDIFVVNDGSDDNSTDAMAELGTTVLQSHGVGAAGARNAGLARVSTDFIAFLDADDCWAPRHLDIALQALERSDACIFAGQAIIIPKNGSGDTGLSRPDLIPVNWGPYILGRNRIVTSGVVLRRACLGRLRFPDSQKWAEDLSLWVDLAAQGCKLCAGTTPTVTYFAGTTYRSVDVIRSNARLYWRCLGTHRWNLRALLGPLLWTSVTEFRRLRFRYKGPGRVLRSRR